MKLVPRPTVLSIASCLMQSSTGQGTGRSTLTDQMHRNSFFATADAAILRGFARLARNLTICKQERSLCNSVPNLDHEKSQKCMGKVQEKMLKPLSLSRQKISTIYQN